MALQFNNYMRDSNGLMAGLMNYSNSPFNTSNTTLYVYPASVAYPNTCPTTVTAGFILSYTGINPGRFTQSNGVITISSTSSANMTASAASNPLSWWLLHNPAGGGMACCSDSVATSTGNNAIVLLSSVTAGSGTSVTWNSFALNMG